MTHLICPELTWANHFSQELFSCSFFFCNFDPESGSYKNNNWKTISSLLERPVNLIYFLKIQAMCDTIEQLYYHLV